MTHATTAPAFRECGASRALRRKQPRTAFQPAIETAFRMQAVPTVIQAVVEKANRMANTALMPML